MALIPDVLDDDPIEASWGNAVRDQGVQVCTAATRPGSPAEGMVIFETDTNRLLVYTGTAWTRIGGFDDWVSYTPTLTNVTIGNGSVFGRYQTTGLTCVYNGSLEVGSTTSFGGAFELSMPLAPVTNYLQTGSARAADASAAGLPRSIGICESHTGTWGNDLTFWNASGQWSNAGNPFAFANGDVLTWAITYRLAAAPSY